jgi:hypothetical protein
MHNNYESPRLGVSTKTSCEVEQVLIAGVGRSGTTWAAEIINYDNRYRDLFEPFLPAEVPEASAFEYLQYLHPEDPNPVLRKQAELIISGKLRNPWTDRGTGADLENDRILIKDIRCNLMLGWLKKAHTKLKILIMVRHPLQVVDSWRELGWGIEYGGKRGDLEAVLSQPNLLEDFPLIGEMASEVNMQDFVERTVFLWGISHYVPMQQLSDTNVYTLFYENLVRQPATEACSMMNFLGRPFCVEQIEPVFSRLSATNFQHRPKDISREELTMGWLSRFTSPQIKRTKYILEMLELDQLYDDLGNPTRASLFAA